jgi:hypothetical protein
MGFRGIFSFRAVAALFLKGAGMPAVYPRASRTANKYAWSFVKHKKQSILVFLVVLPAGFPLALTPLPARRQRHFPKHTNTHAS